MARNLLKELPELIEARVISPETAEAIRSYYQQKEGNPTNRLFLIFGILGALLSGLGIILIIAHNWDDFSRQTKTLVAFVPLVAGQLLCAIALFKVPESRLWRETSATVLFLAIGATISLISQTYHIPGNLSSFLFTWALLGLPLVYLLQSGMAALLYLTGITWFAIQAGYWNQVEADPIYYWPFLAAVLPFYYQLFQRQPQSNFLNFLNWLLPLSVSIALGTVAEDAEEFLFVGYLSLFGLFYQVGTSASFRHLKRRNNGFLMLALAGTLGFLLALSFDVFWDHMPDGKITLFTPETLTAALLTGLAAVLLFRKMQIRRLTELTLMEVVFLLFLLPFFFGYFAPQTSQVLINLLVLALGISTIRSGARKNHLGILNFGLLIITALVVCRFFDTDLSFVARGILFLLVGAGFFLANYFTLKNRHTA